MVEKTTVPKGHSGAPDPGAADLPSDRSDQGHVAEVLELVRRAPQTIVVSSRCDLRSMATVAKYFLMEETPLRTPSELVRLAVAFTAATLHGLGAPNYESTEEALSFLTKVGLYKRDRAFSKLVRQIQEENVRAETGQETVTARQLAQRAKELLESMGEETT